MSKTFSTLPLSADLLKNLESLGYHKMTEVQEKVLPIALASRISELRLQPDQARQQLWTGYFKQDRFIK